MAVYTEVGLAEAEALFKSLGLGTLTDLQGIRSGIENTNYYATTSRGAWVLTLFERLSAAQLPSYLSGLLIGEELRQQAVLPHPGPVLVIGSPALCLRYTLALQHLHTPCQSLGAEATWAGLWALASSCDPS